jgi:hypothetical protein
LLTACSAPENKSTVSESNDSGNTEEQTANVKTEPMKKPADFIPEGYRLFDELHGDLNKDGVNDCVLIVKGTDKKNVIIDEDRGELDRNRRGIIVLLKEKDSYVQVAKNTGCFSSENEDGGVYYAPELSVDIEKGKLFVRYAHGRYGYWSYTFRLNGSHVELIGYDSSDNHGPVINSLVSINFLTGKKQTKTNVNEEAESGDEVFEETWETIQKKEPIKLSGVKDFDELYFD